MSSSDNFPLATSHFAISRLLSETPSSTFALTSSANSSLLNLDTFELSVNCRNLRSSIAGGSSFSLVRHVVGPHILDGPLELQREQVVQQIYEVFADIFFARLYTKCNFSRRHCQEVRCIFSKQPSRQPLLIYITQQDDCHRVRKHQQAVPPGASEHRDAQPRPEQVLADQGAAPRGPLPQGGRSQRPRAQGRQRIRVGPQGHQLQSGTGRRRGHHRQERRWQEHAPQAALPCNRPQHWHHPRTGTHREPPRSGHRIPPGNDRAREHLHERRHHGHEPRRDYPQTRRNRGFQRLRTLPGHPREALQQWHDRTPRVRHRGAPGTRNIGSGRSARCGRRRIPEEGHRQNAGRKPRRRQNRIVREP